jgi:hypothetical protein
MQSLTPQVVGEKEGRFSPKKVDKRNQFIFNQLHKKKSWHLVSIVRSIELQEYQSSSSEIEKIKSIEEMSFATFLKGTQIEVKSSQFFLASALLFKLR